MFVRTAKAHWEGNLKEGQGKFELGSGLWASSYSFHTRFDEEKSGSNPEELLAAAHASCYAMALSFALEQAGYTPQAVNTTATVHLAAVAGGFGITEILLEVKAKVPDIAEPLFLTIAQQAKVNCPISKALSVKITLTSARLLALHD